MNTNSQLTPKIITFLFIIFALAFFLRLIYLSDLMATKIYPVLESSDSSAYYSWGKDVSAGDILGYRVFMKWPLYAYFLGVWFKLFGTNLAPIYFIQFLLGSLNCILVFFITRKFFNLVVSCLATLLCLAYGLFIFFDGLIIYSSLSLVLNSLFLLYLLKIKDNLNNRKMFFCGILLGLGTLTQANILLFGLGAVAWILLKNALSKKSILTMFLIFSSGVLIIVSVSTFRNYLAEKDFVPIAGNLGYNFYAGNNPQSTGTLFSPEDITLNQEDMFRDIRIIAESESGRKLKTSQVSAFWLHKSLDYARYHPVNFLVKFIKKFQLVFSPNEYVHDLEYHLVSAKFGVLNIILKDLRFIMPFVFIGLFLGFKDFKNNFLLYLYLAVISLSIAVFFVTARYRIILVPVFMIFAAVAIDKFINYFRTRQWKALKILIAVWLCLFVISAYSKIFTLPPLEASTALFEKYMLNALLLENKGEYQAALAELKQASFLEPYNRRAVSRQGVIYFKLDKLDQAANCFQGAVIISPLSVDAYYNLGFIYNQQMRFKEAKEMLLKAVALDTYDFKAHFELGEAYALTNDKIMARKEFNLALKYINRWRKPDIEIINRELAAL